MAPPKLMNRRAYGRQSKAASVGGLFRRAHLTPKRRDGDPVNGKVRGFDVARTPFFDACSRAQSLLPMTTKIATKVQLNGALDTARWQRQRFATKAPPTGEAGQKFFEAVRPARV
jgi:hypothetical protein